LNFKNFSQYIDDKNKDINSYLKKVAIITNHKTIPIFKQVDMSDNINELSSQIALIFSDDYTHRNSFINENKLAFNNTNHDLSNIKERIGNFKHLPSMTDDIKKVKSLKFPIIASNKKENVRYKTIGKLKSSDNIYNSFKEDLVPKTKFKVLAFKSEPISIVESINRLPLDVDINRFKMIDQVKEITSKIHEVYSLDIYNIEILESDRGTLYIKSIDRDIKLNPRESVILYEKAYSEYNNRPIPNWARIEIVKEHLGPYYKSKYYDSMLVKSKHTLDYSKYLSI
tara:strand:+ start:89 stop:940 length:852 start_codon:yes stop_codon:yes gene_type:complete